VITRGGGGDGRCPVAWDGSLSPNPVRSASSATSRRMPKPKRNTFLDDTAGIGKREPKMRPRLVASGATRRTRTACRGETIARGRLALCVAVREAVRGRRRLSRTQASRSAIRRRGEGRRRFRPRATPPSVRPMRYPTNWNPAAIAPSHPPAVSPVPCVPRAPPTTAAAVGITTAQRRWRGGTRYPIATPTIPAVPPNQTTVPIARTIYHF
jgi:hypothetical protein